MFGSSKLLSAVISIILVAPPLTVSGQDAAGREPAGQSSQEEPASQSSQEEKAKKREMRRERRARRSASGDPARPPVDGVAGPAEELVVVADTESKVGDLVINEGYVDATFGELRLQADRVTYNVVTGDMVAEGNVLFDEGTDQRVTARRAEINWKSERAVFWDTTGFTNRTQTGEYLFFAADRIEKTGPDTYELYDVTVTACEDAVPKWSFSASRAELKRDDRVKLYSSVFKVKHVPVFLLPYAWIPATRSERKSGFLLPTTGTSNQKGRTLKSAYYQTLGQSADITFRNDIYTMRGLGFGAEFRAQTDERSYISLGSFTVKDRLFGEPGENQGGTAFVGEAVQYLPHGWLAVGNVSFVSSLRFRQVFSDDISQVVDPRRESTFYANNNSTYMSLGILASNATTRLFRPDQEAPVGSAQGTDFDVKIRQAPQVDIAVYPHRIFGRIPVYVSFDSSLGALKREETVEGAAVLQTPAAVQRLDLHPSITVPLPSAGGFAITPSFSFRRTVYSSRIDPQIPAYNPERFTLLPDDPRLDPNRFEFDPGVRLFDRTELDAVIQNGLTRNYAEVSLDLRPPSLEKVFLNEDGSRRFKHLIEPYVTYRLIRGVGQEFEEIIRFDERDAVSNTNEIEYALVNRFFTTSQSSDLGRRPRSRRRSREPSDSEMDIVEPHRPQADQRPASGKQDAPPGTAKPEASPEKAAEPPEKRPGPEAPAPEPTKEAAPERESGEEKQKATGQKQAADAVSGTAPDKPQIGKSEELERGGAGRSTAQTRRSRRAAGLEDEDDEEDEEAGGDLAAVQPYEFLSVKIAQKFFIDRDFGGALVEGRRNQFYPINTISGHSIGGRVRSFSPVHIQARYRPLSYLFGDVRMDVGSEDGWVRNVTLSAGVTRENFLVGASWHLSRRIDLAPNRFEPGTFPGNQLITTFQFGDEVLGWYGGTRIGYDFTDRLVDERILSGQLRTSRSYVGYAFDCCGLQFNYNTFKAGLRNESSFSFTFTLAGIGSFGTAQVAQLAGGEGGRRRGRRARRARSFDDF